MIPQDLSLSLWVLFLRPSVSLALMLGDLTGRNTFPVSRAHIPVLCLPLVKKRISNHAKYFGTCQNFGLWWDGRVRILGSTLHKKL